MMEVVMLERCEKRGQMPEARRGGNALTPTFSLFPSEGAVLSHSPSPGESGEGAGG